MKARFYLKKNEEHRVVAGHPWIFSNEIHSTEGTVEDGEIVSIYDSKKKFVGTGYFNSHSLISIRILSRQDVDIDRKFFEKRICDAISYREKVIGPRDAFRLIFSESDYLPGLIADKYGPYIVLQFLTLGMDRYTDLIVDILNNLLSPKAIVIRNDSPFRNLEGLKQEKRLSGGNVKIEELDNLIIQEDNTKLKVDVWNGQKTGFFLDQRDNRDYFSALQLRGKGLDCFCYSGSLAVRASIYSEVTGIDSSDDALSLARTNSELNGRKDNLNFICHDVFDYLNNCIKRKDYFDWISLDPPAFVKNKKKLKEAVSGYRDINCKAMKLLHTGGILVTSSCSYNLREDTFLRLLYEASREARRDIRIIAHGEQSRDHPTLISMDESKYLKCIFLQII